VAAVRVGLLWRAEWDPPQAGVPIVENCRLCSVFAAFAAVGVAAEPVVYSDEKTETIREQLLELDGVLVWVNPIEHGLDRSKLDTILRDAAAAGVWVSAHPDVILQMATKKVLVDTREMSWGTDTRLYLSASELRDSLPNRLRERGALVLKQQRGMGGAGVWKVELDAADDRSADEPWVRVQQATRDSNPERLRLSEFLSRCEPYFTGGGLMVEQPFLERIGEGMIRVYLTHDEVVGFVRQYGSGFAPPPAGGAPAGKVFELPTATAYSDLRMLVESTWVSELQQTLGIETHALPVIWDADFLYGPTTASGDDTYLLCEINASSTFTFPEHAMPGVAAAAVRRIRECSSRRTHG
jgi:glutathione synthase/RimK-type ligase-like ATP-grasp enzyme